MKERQKGKKYLEEKEVFFVSIVDSLHDMSSNDKVVYVLSSDEKCPRAHSFP